MPPVCSNPPFLYRSISSMRGGIVMLLLSIFLATTAHTATVTIPYAKGVNPDAVYQIAKSLAYEHALHAASLTLDDYKAITLGMEDTTLLPALASALYHTNIQENPSPPYPLPVGDIHVNITLAPSVPVGTGIATFLPQTTLLRMRKEWLKQLHLAAQQGQNAALMAAGIFHATNERKKTLPATIQRIGNSLKALWLYNEALHAFQNTWKTPERLQKLLQEAVALDATKAPLWAALGEVELQLDHPQKALEYLNKALAIQPSMARTFYIRGLGHLRLQQPALAKQDLNTALTLEPDTVAWLRARGAVHSMLEEYAPMCQDFERACALGDCEGLASARERGLCAAQ